jgi:hypothetical protein
VALGGLDEIFVSFPLDVTGPIRVPSPLDDAAIEALLARTLELERQQAAAVVVLEERAGDPSFSDIRVQVERHRDVLEQLGRDLGVAATPVEDGIGGSGGTAAVDVLHRQSLLGWRTLQRVAYASGDRRIDRVVKAVLREKERHSAVLETVALQGAMSGLFRDVE